MFSLAAFFEKDGKSREPIESFWREKRQLSAWHVGKLCKRIRFSSKMGWRIFINRVDKQLCGLLLIVCGFLLLRFHFGFVISLKTDFKRLYLYRLQLSDIVALRRDRLSVILFLVVQTWELQVATLNSIVSSTLIRPCSMRVCLFLDLWYFGWTGFLLNALGLWVSS